MVDAFYVGWQPRAPDGLARFLAPRVAALLAGASLAALLVVSSQQPFAAATFEYGHPRAFAGTLQLDPAPALVRDGRRTLLVAQGKHGLHADPALDGAAVQLSGTLIYRDDQTLIEVVPDTLAAAGGGEGGAERTDRGAEAGTPAAGRAAAGGGEVLGPATLAGEIIDSKCFLGVMKPGNTKLHRDCAVRCISGGVPALLLVRDDRGRTERYLLLSPEGRPLGPEILDRVAEPVSAAGTVVRYDNLLALRVAPADIHRLE